MLPLLLRLLQPDDFDAEAFRKVIKQGVRPHSRRWSTTFKRKNIPYWSYGLLFTSGYFTNNWCDGNRFENDR